MNFSLGFIRFKRFILPTDPSKSTCPKNWSDHLHQPTVSKRTINESVPTSMYFSRLWHPHRISGSPFPKTNSLIFLRRNELGCSCEPLSCVRVAVLVWPLASLWLGIGNGLVLSSRAPVYYLVPDGLSDTTRTRGHAIKDGIILCFECLFWNCLCRLLSSIIFYFCMLTLFFFVI